jgi:AAA15 family ATPase/GTPase
MGFSKIHIQNFRGLKDIEIKGTKKINILLGANNSGKSSVLEGIFLIIGMSNPRLALNVTFLEFNSQ